jgi:DNA-binding MarR family transcriptional regulator
MIRSPSSAIDRFVLADAPGHLLRRCHQRSEELFTAAVGKDGPTRQQIAVLVTVCQQPGGTQTELVGRTGIDKNTLAQMINRLVSRGLLERRRSADDPRANTITATAATHRLLDEILPAVREVQRQILEPLPTELRPVFLHCLRLIAGLGAPPRRLPPPQRPPRGSPRSAPSRARPLRGP